MSIATQAANTPGGPAAAAAQPFAGDGQQSGPEAQGLSLSPHLRPTLSTTRSAELVPRRVPGLRLRKPMRSMSSTRAKKTS